MTTIATAHATTTATADRLFARWADMGTWSEWNSDTEWVRLDGPFATGSTGTLKPKGGPKVKFTIASVVDGREFVDVSHLLGARLTFDHQVTPHETGCAVDVTVSMSGPLAFLWRTALGKSLAAAAQPDLDSLVATVEADARA